MARTENLKINVLKGDYVVLESNVDLSYILCVYREFGIENGINSLIKQAENQHIRREVIIVDDASQDNAVEKAIGLLEPSGITYRVIRNELNSGPSISFNRGAEASSGKYLVFVDADDFFPALAESKSYNTMIAEQGDWLFGKTYKPKQTLSQGKMSEIADLDSLHYDVYEHGILSYILNNARIAATYLMVKRELFVRCNGFDEKCFIQDVPIFLRLASCSSKLIVCHNHLFFFVRSAGTLSSRIKQVNTDSFASHYNFYTEYINQLSEEDKKTLRSMLVSTIMKSFKRSSSYGSGFIVCYYNYLLSKFGFTPSFRKIQKMRLAMPDDIMDTFHMDEKEKG